MIPDREAGHSVPDLLDDAGALMPADDRVDRIGDVALRDVVIGVAEPG